MRRSILLGLALTIACAGILSAHHSISSVYDSRQQVTIDAVLTEFHYVNPHPYLIATASEAGEPAGAWHLEMDNRGELAGVGVTAQTFTPGDRVTVTGSRSRTERRNLYVRKLVRPIDGLEYEQVGASPRLRTR